ncbi:DUF3168 domain-containing protein [Methyloversatilis sp.]|uniref:tail completion protein gp17 n=1 Tax=Methyloversatilis sp. TaxID=2569862 RepID=UPI0035B162C7
MTIEADIQTIFASHAGVTAIVGTHIYPDGAPQDALPVVVHTETTSQTEQTLDGTIVAEAHQVRVECYASTKAGAVALRDACRAALVVAGVPYDSRAPLLNPETGEWGAAIDFIWWDL